MVKVNFWKGGEFYTAFDNTQDRNNKGRRCVHVADPTAHPAFYLREGAGVDAGVGRAYGVRDF